MFQDIPQMFAVSQEQVVVLILSVAAAFLLGLGIALVYRATHRGLSYEQSFLSTLVLLAPIVSLVMIFIQGDLVLSLGLVGSLAIIRFRTPIKDTRDMVFLFWVIAVGLGCGTQNWTPTLIATILLAIVVSVLYVLQYGKPRHVDFVLVVSGSGTTLLDKASEELIERRTISFRVRSYEVREDQWEKIFELRFSRAQQEELDQLIRDVQDLEGVERVSLLAPQLAL